MCFDGKIDVYLSGSTEIPVCALYPETEYKSMLRTVFGKEITFRTKILEKVSNIQELLRQEFRMLVCKPTVAESEKDCFHDLSEILKSAEEDANLREMCAVVRTCPELGPTFDFRWQSMDRAWTFRFFDVFCVGADGNANCVSRAVDLRAAIAVRLVWLENDVSAPAELPAHCYWLSEAQFIAMLVLNDTTSLQKFNDGSEEKNSAPSEGKVERLLVSSQTYRGGEERGKHTQGLESSSEVMGQVKMTDFK